MFGSHLVLYFLFVEVFFFLLQILFHFQWRFCTNYVSCFSFQGLYVSRTLSISSRLLNFLAYILGHSILLAFLYICGIGWEFFFICYLLVWVPLFAPWWAWSEGCHCSLGFRRTSSSFQWFFSSLFIFSGLGWFLLLILRFVCSSNSFKW